MDDERLNRIDGELVAQRLLLEVAFSQALSSRPEVFQAVMADLTTALREGSTRREGVGDPEVFVEIVANALVHLDEFTASVLNRIGANRRT